MRSLFAALLIATLVNSAAYADQTITLTMDNLIGGVPLSSFSMSTRKIATNPATCGEIQITKQLDKSSALLIAAVYKGTHISNASIIVRTDGKISYIVQLQNVVVTSVSQSDGTSIPGLYENVSLQVIRYTYQFYGPASTFGWDCQMNSQI